MLTRTCIILATLVTTAISVSFSGTFTSPSMYIPLTYTTTTANSYVTFTTAFSPQKSEAILVAKTVPYTPSVNPLDWQHINPKSTTQFDYEALLTAKSQMAWLSNPGLGTTVYFYIINLSLSATASYSINIAQVNVLPLVCATGMGYYLSTFYCNSCISGFTGTYCSIPLISLKLGELQGFDLAGNSYVLFVEQGGDNVELEIQSKSAGVTAFVQYDVRAQEQAGLVNHINDGVYPLTGASTYTIALSSGDSTISVGLLNSNAFPVKISVKFKEPSHIVVMIIVIAVLGSLLLIAVLATIILIVKKSREQHRIVHPLPSGLLRTENVRLTAREIDRYFPPVVKSDIVSVKESISNLQEVEEKQEAQCIICLESIKSTEQIRAAFCKHIFHAKCLFEWFLKQQNCPYCRQDYTREATVQLYKSLRKQQGQSLKGVDLVRAIFRPKLNATLETLVVQDIEQQPK